MKKRASGYQSSRDRLGIYKKLVDAGLSPERANFAAQQVSRGVWDFARGEVRDAAGRIVYSLAKAG